MRENTAKRQWLLGLFGCLQLVLVVSCTTTSTNRRAGIKPPDKRKSVGGIHALARDDQSPFAHAILVNGGQSAKANFFSHVVHLRGMRKALRSRKMNEGLITIFSSDGDDTGDDLMVVDTIPPQLKLLFRYRFERAFFEPIPRLINTVIPGKKLRPSTRWALDKFFSELGRQLPDPAQGKGASQRPVLLFVTDHGTRNRRWRDERNQKISLWNESINVEQFSQLLRPLRHRRVVYVMSQCFSGSFLWSVFPRPGILEAPEGNRCGFFSTTAKRYAYGCYAQTQREEHVGHAHRFIKAMRGAKTLVEAHERVLLTDKTPDVPLRSSDGYLRALLEREARRARLSLSVFASQVLAKYGAQSGGLIDREQRLIDALAKRFSLARPRDVKEIPSRIKQLQKRRKFRKGISRIWRSAYNSLRGDYLRQFYKQYPGMFERMKRKWKQLMRDLKQQKPLQADPDVARLRDGFKAFLLKQPGVMKRLKRLESELNTSKSLDFWAEVQMAVMMRMASLYYRMAGRLLLRHKKGGLMKMYHRGLQRLLACENASLGPAPQGFTQKKLKPLSRDRSAAIPSLLGIQFRNFRPARKAKLPAGTVQVRAVGLRTPAERAGVQRGDLLIGANGKSFRAFYDLREQIMLHASKVPFVLHVKRGDKRLKLPVKLAAMKTPNFLKYRSLKNTVAPSLSSLKVLSAGKSLPDVTKEPTLLFFWATWCGPCKSALPTLRAWHQKYPRLKIVASSTEKRTKLDAWYAKKPDAMPFLRTRDAQGELALKMLVFSFPTFVVIRGGRVIHIHKGAHKFALLEQKIQQALK